ncbi:hypothetical protein RDI58_013037 [Solanum bulbocastanum]|uniref:DUF4216 domain-containing protein n=1 Tax=Solanum bulbocastanum TaxID=147425 RepID=A0AAN8YHC0_SOLBU
MPEGYASNLGKQIDMNEGKLIGMKSHDCHVFMTTLIPIAFRHLPVRTWKPITEISLFFKDLCSGKFLESSLDRMEENIPVITTKLEKIFPCGFFDVMEHLPIHLVQEARSEVQFKQDGCIHLRGNIEIFKISRNKKTNNSGVFIQGVADGTGQTIEYYGVIHEIIKVRYSGRPKKKIILFRCKWFDPSHRGTKVDQQHNIIEVKHTRKYRSYDFFIIEQNAKQVYYAPYPLRKDKTNWWIVIKTKPVGRIEIDNVLDVAYQNEVAIVQQQVDVELETTLEHPQDILEEVSNDEIMINVEDEINEDGENDSFDNEEYDNENETTKEEEWETDASFTSQSLPLRCYKDLPLQAIRRAQSLSISRTPSPTGISPQLSAMRIRDSSSKQSDVVAGTPPLTQHYVHPGVSPTPDETFALAPG